jgi:hypothetical protein
MHPDDRDGRPLEVGDEWKGVHPGIPYKLKAGARDIASEEVVAQQLAARLRAVMEFDGGRGFHRLSVPLPGPAGGAGPLVGACVFGACVFEACVFDVFCCSLPPPRLRGRDAWPPTSAASRHVLLFFFPGFRGAYTWIFVQYVCHFPRA